MVTIKNTKTIAIAVLVAGGIALLGFGGDTFSQQVKAQAATLKPATQALQNAAANTALDGILANVNSQYGSKVGIVVYDTSTGHTSSTNAQQQFVSASLYKLYVAYGVLREVDNGTISLNDPIDSLDESVSDCLNKMITVSDNDCGKALGELVGWSSLDSLLASQGYTGTMLNNYDDIGTLSGDKQTTAADVSLLLQRLYAGTLLAPSSNTLFLNLLGSQEINSYLPSGFPDGTRIAHKTGTLYGYVHDAGIVYGAHTNLIVIVMSGQWTDPDTDSIPFYTALGQSLGSYLQKY